MGSGSIQPSKSVSSARKAEISHDSVSTPAPTGEKAGPMPAMNCFSADTKVYTQNGEKTMKEVLVGDFVSFSLLKYIID